MWPDEFVDDHDDHDDDHEDHDDNDDHHDDDDDDDDERTKKIGQTKFVSNDRSGHDDQNAY